MDLKTKLDLISKLILWRTSSGFVSQSTLTYFLDCTSLFIFLFFHLLLIEWCYLPRNDRRVDILQENINKNIKRVVKTFVYLLYSVYCADIQQWNYLLFFKEKIKNEVPCGNLIIIKILFGMYCLFHLYFFKKVNHHGLKKLNLLTENIYV